MSFARVEESLFRAPLTARGWRVYLALLSHLRGDDRECYPSLARLATLTAIQAHHVSIVIDELVKAGLVQRHIRPRPDTTSYTLLVPSQVVPATVVPAEVVPSKVVPPAVGSTGSGSTWDGTQKREDVSEKRKGSQEGSFPLLETDPHRRPRGATAPPVPASKAHKGHPVDRLLRRDRNPEVDALVVRIFEAWCTVMGKNAATQLDRARYRAIQGALAMGLTEARCLDAIRGCRASKWHMGGNPEGRRHDELGLIFRDAEHVERFEAEGRRAGNGAAPGSGAPLPICAYSRLDGTPHPLRTPDRSVNEGRVCGACYDARVARERAVERRA